MWTLPQRHGCYLDPQMPRGSGRTAEADTPFAVSAPDRRPQGPSCMGDPAPRVTPGDHGCGGAGLLSLPGAALGTKGRT